MIIIINSSFLKEQSGRFFITSRTEGCLSKTEIYFLRNHQNVTFKSQSSCGSQFYLTDYESYLEISPWRNITDNKSISNCKPFTVIILYDNKRDLL